jgi:glutamate carboxypeptidase
MELSELKPWIAAEREAFLQNLEALVNINTFTANTEGVDQGMKFVSDLAVRMGLQVEMVKERHRLIKSGNGQGPRILLISHVDTVHPPDGGFLHYEPQAEGYVRGPGVGDMKGGLLMGLWTLKAMQQLAHDFDVQLVVSADEETGSPSLQDWYLANGSGARYGLGLEPGFPQGPLTPEVVMGVVEERKGCGRILFSLQGKAAHAGGEWEKGLSAIQAMAQRVVDIHALIDTSKGITTNVGLVNGGTAANTIAEKAAAQVDYRFKTQADAEATYAAIRQIVHQARVHNPHLDLWEQVTQFEQTVYLPPMEASPANRMLVDLVLGEADRLGQKVLPISRGGGSDANYTSGGGVPSICGMGAPAENIHSPQERILLPMLFDRLELLIASTFRLATC